MEKELNRLTRISLFFCPIQIIFESSAKMLDCGRLFTFAYHHRQYSLVFFRRYKDWMKPHHKKTSSRILCFVCFICVFSSILSSNEKLCYHVCQSIEFTWVTYGGTRNHWKCARAGRWFSRQLLFTYRLCF